MKYKFKAKDLKTDEWVEGDLAYVSPITYCKVSKDSPHTVRVVKPKKPMILHICAHGGMIFATSRYWADEDTIELIKEE